MALFSLALAALSSSLSLIIFSWLTAILGNLKTISIIIILGLCLFPLSLPCLKPLQPGEHQLDHLPHRHGLSPTCLHIDFLNINRLILIICTKNVLGLVKDDSKYLICRTIASFYCGISSGVSSSCLRLFKRWLCQHLSSKIG